MDYVLRLTDNGHYYYLKPDGMWWAGSGDAKAFATEADAKNHLSSLGRKVSRTYKIIERVTLAEAR